MRPTDKKWTEEEVEILTKLFYDGVWLKDIAPQLNRTYSSTKAKAIQLELRRNNCGPSKNREKKYWTKEIETKAIEMFYQKIKMPKIALALDMSDHCVRYHLKKIGLETEYGKWLKENKTLSLQGLKRCAICGEIKPKTKEYFRQIKNMNNGCLECLIQDDNAFWNQKINSLYRRCKKSGVFCNLTKEELINCFVKQNGKCFYTNVDLNTECNGRKSSSLSIDRIIPEKGYTKDNVVLCCFIINHMKYTQTLDELFYWSDLIIQNKAIIQSNILGNNDVHFAS